ncbi:uncharacterized protein LOC104582449 [Brachypodium distachyon]|uniref:uncharacterized protein LOC104582449 n=1 Tax=Brachypodium distachyon TaxID=15368 RepID=UPI000530065F|nr:uncharacterized protein LOC104582449 [Brachypodium distachyon]|eukprot:XP_010230311.1 uncharacterized protein LOC104582449 [Brachypodium distachyon]
MAKACGATRLMIKGNSNLVVQQTMKACDAISDTMIAYRDMYNLLEGQFDGCELRHISRSSNEEADKLANIGSTRTLVPPGVYLEVIEQRCIKEKSTATPVKQPTDRGATPAVDSAMPMAEEKPGTPKTARDENSAEVLLAEPTWMQPFLAYMLRQELPNDAAEARRIARRSKAFKIINGELYKQSVSGILQWCIVLEEGRALLLDIHQGTCGHHASSRAITAKAFRAGFYWPTAQRDSHDIVSKCEACQMFATKPHAPASELKTIPLTWPFAQWGLDMVGPLQKSSPSGHTSLLVAIDKFSKWIEAMPIRVPHSINTDNGSNFLAQEFKDFCEQMGIHINYAAVAHLQTNGQVEKANGLITDGVRK